jgi:DNA-binding CsgD family transcriptional regulator
MSYIDAGARARGNAPQPGETVAPARLGQANQGWGLPNQALQHFGALVSGRRSLAEPAQLDHWGQVAEALTLPLLVIDPDGRLLDSNAAGQSVLTQGLPLAAVSGRLTARRAADGKALRSALEQVRTQRADRLVCGLPNRDGSPRLILDLRQLGGASSPVLVILSNPQLSRPPDAALLVASFGLTRGEAQVAALLSTGLDVFEIAARLGLQVGTVRNHLKRAMAKTCTNSQSQLSVLVARGLTSA